jgi:hypothetical protein
MYRVDKEEQFPILVQLVNEQTGELATGETVYYDIRVAADDSELTPAVSGTLIESTVESGLYKNVASISEPGRYIIYAICFGFLTNSEELIVNPESVYDLTKQNRNYNTLVEDVIRTNVTPTPSQTTRKVSVGNTDHIITKIKHDYETTWSGTTISGAAYAWYKSESDSVPYLMGGPF